MPLYTLEQLQTDSRYQNATPEMQQKYTTDFQLADQQEKEQNVAIAKETDKRAQIEKENKYNSFFTNMGKQVYQGSLSTLDAIRSVDDAMTGDIDSDTGKRLAEASQRDNYVPSELKEAHSHIAAQSKQWDQANGFWEKSAAALGTVGATLKEATQNPEGVAYLAAQSITNAVPGMVLGTAGFFTPIPGAAAAGQFSGSFATETGAYFNQLVSQEVTKRGLDNTEKSYNLILSDEDFITKARTKAARKGVGTAAVDTLLAHGTARLATAPGRQAEKIAISSFGSGATKEAITAEAKAILKSRSVIAKAKTAGKVLGTEILSEPISEAAGELAAEGKVDAGELMAETLGAFGMGPIMAPTNVAIHGGKTAGKIVSNKIKESANPNISVKEAAKKSLLSSITKKTKEMATPATPESIARKEAKIAGKIQEKKLSDQAKAPTAFQYKKDVNELATSGKIKEVAKKNPIMAVDALLTKNKKEDITPVKKIINYDQGIKIRDDLKIQHSTMVKEIMSLKNKGDNITEIENDRMYSLMKQVQSLQKTSMAIKPIVESMAPDVTPMSETEQVTATKQIKTALKSQDAGVIDKAILSVFGSKKSSKINIDEVMNAPETSAIAKEKLKPIQEYQQAEKVLIANRKPGKSTEAVNIDVIEGGPGFKGIKDYMYSITTALQSDDKAFAQKQANAMNTFAKEHTAKSELFQKALQVGWTPEYKVTDQTTNKFSKTDHINMLERNNTRQAEIGSGYNFSIPAKVKGFVNTIALEAKALTKATQAASAIISPTTIKTPNIYQTELTDMGFNDREIIAMGNDNAKRMIPYKEHSIKKLINLQELLPSGIERDTVSKALTAKTRQADIQKPVSTERKQEDITSNIESELFPGDIESELSPGDIDTLLNETKIEPEKEIKDTPSKIEEIPSKIKDTPSKIEEIPEVKEEVLNKSSLQNTLITKSKTDSNNPIIKTFKTKKIKDITKKVLQSTGDAIQHYTIPALQKIGLFPDLVKDTKQEVVVKEGLVSIEKFTDQFRKAFNKEFKDPEQQVVNKNNLKNMIIKQMPKQPENKSFFVNKLFTLDAFKTNDQNYTDQQIIDILETNKKNLPIVLYKYLINKFNARMKKDKKDFRGDDPIQYLPKHINTINALAAASYEYLGSLGTNTIWNDNSALQKILRLSSKQHIHPVAQELLGKAGHTQNMLIESIGPIAFKLLGIQPDKETADEDAQNRLEQSLALQAIATMEGMGILKMSKVFMGAKGKQAIDGLNGLMNLHATDSIEDFKNIRKHFHVDPNNREMITQKDGTKIPKYKGEGEIAFYRIVSEPGKKLTVRKDINEAYIIPFKNSKNTWEELFGVTGNKKSYSWTAPKYTEDMAKVKRSPFPATEEEASKISSHQQRPREVSSRMMNMFLLLGSENLKTIQGWVNPDSRPNVERDSIRGTNLGIEKGNQAVFDWLDDAKIQPDKYKAQFYVPEEFWVMHRMGESSTINMQGNGSHRALFNFTDWNQTLDITDPVMKDQFMEAIGLNLDIEHGKKGGLQEAIKATEKLLTTEDIALAIKAIQKVIAGQESLDELSPEKMNQISKKYTKEMAIIAKGAKATGMELRGLKSLVEYARYQTALQNGDKEFTTDTFTEVDGVGNGMFIGRMQLTGDTQNFNATLAALENGGAIFNPNLMIEDTENNGVLSKHLSKEMILDAYKSVGFQLSNFLDKHKRDVLTIFETSQKTGDTKETQIQYNTLKTFEALENLFGSFRDKEGMITKLTRAFPKKPTMTAVYGRGDKTLKRSLGDTLIKDISKKIGDAVTDKNVSALQQINNDLKAITGMSLFTDAELTPGNVRKSVIFSQELPIQMQKTIHEATTDIYGEALLKAIDVVYGDMRSTFKPLNDGVNVSAAMYSTIREIRLNSLREKAISNPERLSNKLTIKEVEDLNKELKILVPYLTSPAGSKISLVKESKERQYNIKKEPNIEIKQTYKSGRQIKKSYPYSQGGIQSPGVGGTIKGIHNIDSTAALDLMSQMPMLNTHDGFSGGVGMGHDMAHAANKSMFETLEKYHMAESMLNACEDITSLYENQLTALITQGIIKQQEANKILAKHLINNNLSIVTTESSPKKAIIDQTNIKNILEIVHTDMSKIAQITKENKQKITDSMVALEQYSYPGAHYITGKKAKAIVYNGQTFNPQDITADSTTVINTEDKLAKALRIEINQIKKDLVLGSTNSDLSIDPDDYAKEQQINKMNVVDVYNQIKNDGLISIGSKHDSHLQKLLQDIVQKVMKPIGLYMTTNPDRETEGAFVSNKQQIFISTQTTGNNSGILNQGIRMSTGEVYTHEMFHNILHVGLKENTKLRRQVKSLFKIAQKELNKNNEGFRAFLNDPTIDITDPAYQYEVEAAKERYDYIFNNAETVKSGGIDSATGIDRTQEMSNYLDEFITFGLTNKNFINALAKIQLVKTSYAKHISGDLIGDTIIETLQNIFQKVMDFFYQKFTTHTSGNVMSQELENLALSLSKYDSKQKSKVYQAILKSDMVSSKFAHTMNNYIKAGVKKLPIAKTAIALKETVTMVKESDTAIGQWLREVGYAYRKLDHGIVKSIIAEASGRTDRLAWIHELTDKRNIWLDAAKESETETTIKVSNELFKEKPTDQEKISITKAALKTDMVTLLNSFGLTGIQKMLENSDEINKQINNINNDLKADLELSPYADYYNHASDAMGHFMVHSRARKGEVVFQNSWLIAELKNHSADGEVTGAAAKKAHALIEQLGSLYALKYTANNHKNNLLNLLKTDDKGINGVLRLHEVLKEKAVKGAFQGDKYKFIKGYTKQIINPRIGFKYGTLADEETLTAAGYRRQNTAIGRDLDDPTNNIPFYIYTSKTGRANDWNSGVLSVTSSRHKGTASDRIAQELNLSPQEVKKQHTLIAAQKNKNINAMGKGFVTTQKTGNFLIPSVNSKGQITQYRYMMADSTKDAYLEQKSEFDTVFGAMAGQAIDKSRTNEINTELLMGLKTMYDKEYHNNPEAFVEISANSPDVRLQEIYSMIPVKTRNEAEKIWGSPSIKVSNDILDMAFGYRQYSLVDAFTKNPQELAKLEKIIITVARTLFRGNAVHIINNLETLAMEATKIAKSSIIVKSLHITVGNLGSNMMYLKSKGVPVSQIIKLGYEATVMGDKYQRDNKALNQEKLKLAIAIKNNSSQKSIKGKIARLKTTLALNPTTKTIEAGLMPSLVDDIETVTGGQTFQTGIEKRVSAVVDKFPSLVQTVGKNILMTEDTVLFKALNNAVKMTDFIGRYILYNHYTKKEGMSHKEAIISVTDEFVNFNIPTNQKIEYGNLIGALWFTKYGTRILKVIKDAAIAKPYDFFMSLILSNTMGLDNIANSIPGVTKNLFQNVGDPFTAFMDSTDEPVLINLLNQTF